jgi:polar amino acid transport system substrate-binding protein
MLWNALLSLLLGFSLCLMSVSTQAEESKAVHFVDSPYPPYSIGELGKAPTGGVAVELVNEIFNRLGVKLSIEMHPWKRTLKMAELGRADGITLLMRDEERSQYLTFSEVVFEGKEVFYYNRDRLKTFEWSSFADLEPYKIGLVNGYTYGEDFLKAIDIFGLKVEYDDSDDICLQKLMAGRIDLFLVDDLVSKTQIAQNDDMKKSLAVSSKPVTVYPYYVAFSRQSQAKDLLPEINRVISEMKADGSIDRVVGRSR